MKIWSLLVALGMAAGAPSAYAQIVVENAGTVSPETPTWQSRFEIDRYKNVTDLRATENLYWAPDPRTEFKLSAPLLRRELDLPDGTESLFGGLGDLELHIKRIFHKSDDVMRSTRFSAMGGLVLPTGPWHEEDGGVDIPRSLQLGTGTLGFFGGPLFTHIADRHRFAFEAIGQAHAEHDDYRPQPSLRLGAAYWYRISPAALEVAGDRTEVRGSFELIHTVYGRSVEGGTRVGDDGTTTMLSVGLQVYPTTSPLFEAAVLIPLHETKEDLKGDRRIGFLLSIKFLF